MYNHPSQELAEYLVAEGTALTGEIFVDFAPEIDTLSADVITVVKMINGTPNPRWARDNITVVVQTIGGSKGQLVNARDQVWSVYNKLLGAYNIDLDGYTYFQFTSQEMPNFIGYLENAKPLYTSSLSFVREAQTKEGNRDVIY